MSVAGPVHEGGVVSGPGAGDPRVGLCSTCRHARIVPTPRATYWLCELSAIDNRFDKYPRLPVLACDGYARKDPAVPGG